MSETSGSSISIRKELAQVRAKSEAMQKNMGVPKGTR